VALAVEKNPISMKSQNSFLSVAFFISGAFEFQPGHDYYFMSTSSNKNLRQKSGGKCRTHNMRLVFRIRDVELKDDFRSFEQRSFDVVAQPRNDVSDEDDDYDDDEDIENESVENDHRQVTEKASPVTSNRQSKLPTTNFLLFAASLILSLVLSL
jgi:hypothetical protein